MALLPPQKEFFMLHNESVSMVAVLPYQSDEQSVVAAFVGPLAATADQAGFLMDNLRKRGFLKRHPSFHICEEYPVRKIDGGGYHVVEDQPKDPYIVGAANMNEVDQVCSELGKAIKRSTGRDFVFSVIPSPMLQLVAKDCHH